jgi:hypothetical protein
MKRFLVTYLAPASMLSSSWKHTPPWWGRLLHCGISIRVMSANRMVRPCSGPASKGSWEGAPKTRSTPCHTSSTVQLDQIEGIQERAVIMAAVANEIERGNNVTECTEPRASLTASGTSEFFILSSRASAPSDKVSPSASRRCLRGQACRRGRRRSGRRLPCALRQSKTPSGGSASGGVLALGTRKGTLSHKLPSPEPTHTHTLQTCCRLDPRL